MKRIGQIEIKEGKSQTLRQNTRWLANKTCLALWTRGENVLQNLIKAQQKEFHDRGNQQSQSIDIK